MSIPPGPAIGLCRRTAPVGTEIAHLVKDGLLHSDLRILDAWVYVEPHPDPRPDRAWLSSREAPVPLVKCDESGAYNRAAGSAVHEGVREVLFEGFDARFYFAEPAR